MSEPFRQPGVRPPVEIATELAILLKPERRIARVRLREDVAGFRLKARQLQGSIRLADALAKLSGGSLLTATLLLIVNGQMRWPVLITAVTALLVFASSTILLVLLDRKVAVLEHAVDLVEAALKEAGG